MIKLLKNVPLKGLIISLIIDLLVGATFVVLYVFRYIPETVFLIVLFIVLITSSFLSSSLMERHFRHRFDKKRRGKLYFCENAMLQDATKEQEVNYGYVQIKTVNRKAFFLTRVTNAGLFFSEEQGTANLKIDLKKFDKVIQFYIFDSKDSAYRQKMIILNYQAQNFYIGSFVYDEERKEIYQADNVVPNKEYESIYDEFIKMLKFQEK